MLWHVGGIARLRCVLPALEYGFWRGCCLEPEGRGVGSPLRARRLTNVNVNRM